MSKKSKRTATMSRRLSSALCLVLLLAVSACRQDPETTPLQESGSAPAAAESSGLTTLQGSAVEVDTETAHQTWLNEDVILIDVREPEEYAEGHIPGITLIPMGEVGARLDEIPSDQPVILTCRTGRRSLIVAEELREQGYDQVYSMRGGIVEWEGAGLEVER